MLLNNYKGQLMKIVTIYKISNASDCHQVAKSHQDQHDFHSEQ